MVNFIIACHTMFVILNYHLINFHYLIFYFHSQLETLTMIIDHYQNANR